MSFAPEGGGYSPPAAYATPRIPTFRYGGSPYSHSAPPSPYSGASPSTSSVPSFAALDPGYQAALASQQAGNQNADSAYKAALSQALIGFGDSSLASQYKNLDPNIATAIQANTASGNSILAQLQHALATRNEQNKNALAARGLLGSGGLAGDLTRNAQGYSHSLHDAQQQLLSQLQGYLQNYLSQKQGYQDQVNQALQTAYQNYIQNPALYQGGR